MSHAKHFTVPHPICTSIRHAIYHDRDSGNWAGHVAPNYDYGNVPFTVVQSEWVQPTIGSNPNWTDWRHAPTVSFWDGLGEKYLIQAGCDSIQTSSPVYKCWTEDFPQGTVYEGPLVHPNDLMYIQVQYLGNHQANYFMDDIRTGETQSFTNSAPDVDQSTADYIVERLMASNTNDYLPNFGTVVMSNDTFQSASNTYNLVSTENQKWVMTSDCSSTGKILSAPGAVDNAQFSQVWYASSPYSNTCP
jgi:hypothetical protein